MKHFPGDGPQELGMDPHYSLGKFQYYQGNFAYHMKPFIAGIKAGVSSIMPYYDVPMSGRDASKNPIPLTYAGVTLSADGLRLHQGNRDRPATRPAWASSTRR